MSTAGEPARAGARGGQPYAPSGFILGSIGLHLAAAGGFAAAPVGWPWFAGSILANHALIALAGMIPGNGWLGENRSRLGTAAAARGEVAITIDDGPDPEITPRILEILARHGARASFFAIGERAARQGALVREMVRAGHSVENHTWGHPAGFAAYGPWRFQREIARAQEAIAAAAGVRPRYFRPPAGLRNVLLYPVLARLGLVHVSWTRRGLDTVASDPAMVVRRLTAGLAGGDILLLHDGHHRRDAPGRPAILAVLPALLEHLAARGLRAVSLPEADRTAVAE